MVFVEGEQFLDCLPDVGVLLETEGEYLFVDLLDLERDGGNEVVDLQVEDDLEDGQLLDEVVGKLLDDSVVLVLLRLGDVVLLADAAEEFFLGFGLVLVVVMAVLRSELQLDVLDAHQGGNLVHELAIDLHRLHGQAVELLVEVNCLMAYPLHLLLLVLLLILVQQQPQSVQQLRETTPPFFLSQNMEKSIASTSDRVGGTILDLEKVKSLA